MERGFTKESKRVIAFITGATSGFGAAIARKFLASGAKVIGTGRRQNALDDLKRELGSQFLPVLFDVRDRPAVEQAIAGLPPEFANVTVLVNNAGLAIGLEPARKSNLDEWDVMI